MRGWGGNMDNYAVINGKRVELTDEQVKALGVETRKNPFERVAMSDEYYTITEYDNINEFTEDGDGADQNLYDAANYFNDEAFAKQVSLHQLLYRKLLKFVYDNGCEDRQLWGTYKKHHYIFYSYSRKMFGVKCDCDTKLQVVYFSSSDDALRAIREVVKPFMEEHPDFVW